MKKLKVKLELYITLTEPQADVLQAVENSNVKHFASKSLNIYLPKDLYSFEIIETEVEKD